MDSGLIAFWLVEMFPRGGRAKRRSVPDSPRPRSEDRYGRLLAYVYTGDAESIAEKLIQEGLGRAWTRGTGSIGICWWGWSRRHTRRSKDACGKSPALAPVIDIDNLERMFYFRKSRVESANGAGISNRARFR